MAGYDKNDSELPDSDRSWCKRCGDQHLPLHVYCLRYSIDWWKVDDNLLVILCDRCYRQEAEKDFLELIAKLSTFQLSTLMEVGLRLAKDKS